MRSFPLLKYYLTLTFPYGQWPCAQGLYTERTDIAAKSCFKDLSVQVYNWFLERQENSQQPGLQQSPFLSTGLIPQVPATHSYSFPNNAVTGQLGQLGSWTKLSHQPAHALVKRRALFHKISKLVCPILQLHKFSARGAIK